MQVFVRPGSLAVLLLLAASLVVACGPATPDIGTLPTPTQGVPIGSLAPPPTGYVVPPDDARTPTTDAVRELRDITTKPDLFAGKQVTVEGVLEARGPMPNPRFFLRGPAGDLLEVQSWLPLEVILPQKGGSEPRSMPYYIGKVLRLTGTVEKGPEGVILQVLAAEER
jgi:hypothetical protein